MSGKLEETFRAARLRGVPIVTVATPDQPATIQLLRGEAASTDRVPLLRWDVVTGMVPLNGAGELALLQVAGVDPATYNRESEEQVVAFQQAVKALTENPDAALVVAKKLPGYDERSGALGAVLFFCNAHLFLTPEFPGHVPVRQAVCNLRDPYKGNHRMLVLLGPEFALPPELAGDVIPLEDPYPDDEQLRAIVLEQFRGAELPTPTAEALSKAVDAVRGIHAFAVEQITAMSLRKSGLDVPALRERKRKELEKLEGMLTVDREVVRFAEVGGKAQVKTLLRGIFTGKRPPGLIVRLDEGEKFMAGAGTAGGPGDSTGVSQDQEGVLLKEMEDNKYIGIVLVSPAGVGKTHLSRAVAGEFDVMSIGVDLGGAKEKWVGSSERNIRRLFRAIKGTAGPGGAFFILCCNKLEALSPAVRRRFTLGIWYDDLPTAEEREQIWQIQLAKYRLPADAPRPDDAGWTGADIRNCCDVADRMAIPLTAAAQFLVPVSRSDPGSIDKLRAMAKGSFLSTAYPGPYQGPEGGPKSLEMQEWLGTTAAPAPRKIKVGKEK